MTTTSTSLINSILNSSILSGVGKKFSQYTLSEISNIKVIKLCSMFIISYATLSGFEVILITLRYYEFKDLEFDGLINNSKLFKYTSKYFLEKIGYAVDDENNSLIMIYEKQNGKILDFDDFNCIISDNDIILKKLYLAERIISIFSRLKSTGIKIGYISPEIFLYDQACSTPLKLIDFTFNYIYGGLPVTNPFIRYSFGVLDSLDLKKTMDLEMCLVLLTGIFSEKFIIPYSKLISKFYNEYNILKKKKKDDRGGDDDYEKFLDIVKKSVSNKKIAQFIEKFIKGIFENLSSKPTNSVKDEAVEFEKFYKDFDENYYKKIISEFKCKDCNIKQAEIIYNTCYDPLCKGCVKLHKCNIIQYIQIDKIKKNSEILSENFKNIKGIFNSIPPRNIFNSYLDTFYPKNIPNLKTIHSLHNEIQSEMIRENLCISSNLTALINYMKEELSKGVIMLKKKLEQYKLNYHDEEEMENSIKKLSSMISKLNNKLENVLKKVDFNSPIKKFIKISSYYRDYVKYFRQNTLKSIYNEINTRVVNRLTGDNSLSNFISTSTVSFYRQLDLLNGSKNFSQFFFPNFETRKLIRFYNINVLDVLVQNDYSTSEIQLDFNLKRDDFFLTYFPLNCRWISYKSFIIFTGGDDNKLNPNKNKSLNVVFLVDTNHFKIEVKCSMNEPRSCHSLCKYNKTYIIAVGGQDRKTCEIYSILKNRWYNLPSMNSEKMNATVVLVNKFQLYCFGWQYSELIPDQNIKTNNYLIECLDVSLYFNEFNSYEFIQDKTSITHTPWTKIHCKLPSFSSYEFNFLPIKLKEKNQILFLGGNKTYIYDFKTNEMNLKSQFDDKNEMKFYESYAYEYNEKLISVGLEKEKTKSNPKIYFFE